MLITLTNPGGTKTVPLCVSDTTTLGTIRCLAEADFGNTSGKANKLALYHGATKLLDTQDDCSLAELQICDGALLLVGVAQPSITLHSSLDPLDHSNQALQLSNSLGRGFRATNSPTDDNDGSLVERAERLIKNSESNPRFTEGLLMINPDLANAVGSKNQDLVVQVLQKERDNLRKEDESLRRRWIQALEDPLHPQAQQLLLQQIQQQQIDEQLLQAQEFLPESLGNIVMLYILVEVNCVKLRAFVDCGAQWTVMSLSCAKKCNLDRLIDTRFKGIAEGVGLSKVVGKIHMVQLKIQGLYLAASITVLDGVQDTFLLGLDVLRGHQCIVDLKENVLRIRDEKVPFLPELETKGSIFLSANAEIGTQSQCPSPGAGLAAPTSSASSSNDALASSRGLATSAHSTSTARLMELGFSAEQATNALRLTDGDVFLAATLLLSQRPKSS